MDFTFGRDLAEIAHMVYDGEWVSLEPFPVELFCTRCPYRVASTGREFTIDIDAGVVTYGVIDKEPG